MSYMTDIPKEMRMELANYLRELKEKRKIAFNQISIKSRINARSLNLIFKGETKRISPYQLKNLATVLKVDYKKLYKIVEYLDDADFEISEKKNNNPETSDDRITVYDDISYTKKKISAGNAIEYIKLPALGNSDEFFGIIVKENAMCPYIPKGAVVIVERNGIIEDNEIGLFLINNETHVRRYFKEGRNTILTSEDNKARPIIIEKNMSFFIVGRVVKVIFDL